MEGITNAGDTAMLLGAALAEAAHRFWRHPAALEFIDLRDPALYRKGAAQPKGRMEVFRAAIESSPELSALYQEVLDAARRYAGAVSQWEKEARLSAYAASQWERWHCQHGRDVLETLCGLPADLAWLASPEGKKEQCVTMDGAFERDSADPLRKIRDRMLDAIGGDPADESGLEDDDLLCDYLPERQDAQGRWLNCA